MMNLKVERGPSAGVVHRRWQYNLAGTPVNILNPAVGTRLGPYEIVHLLGAGGMGEVYRARDTRLGRDVALKFLPEEFTADRDRLARFEREARLLASVNHPNIATIHGVEEAASAGRQQVRAIVLELVEGATLADRVRRGPLHFEEALAIARQIAQALDAAHEKGVIHRDLKPANIKITPEGRVKVLDFGLAKALAGEPDASDLSGSPTMTGVATRTGVLLGTAAYMSPEQARGLAVDKRTDIWAFGCVLYELLAGKQAFGAATLTDTLAAIVDRDPDWNAVAGTPPPVVRLLRRCLEKHPSRRLRDIADAFGELDVNVAPVTPRSDRPRQRMIIATVAAVAGLVAGAAAMAVWRGPLGQPDVSAAAVEVIRSTELVPTDAELAPAPALAISPDGRRIAFVARHNGAASLYVRNLREPSARALPGTDGADQPFFSPDGRWLGFFADARLKKISLTGAAPVVLAEAPAPRGGSWAADDTIVFAPATTAGLMRIAAEGGMAEAVTMPDRTLNEASHRWPHVLPDGETVLFAAGPTVSARNWIEAHVVVQSLKTGARKLIAPSGAFPSFLRSGHVIYVQDGVAFAQPFDPSTWETGEAAPVIDGVATLGGINGGAFQMALSSSGTLLAVPAAPHESQTFVWVDRNGVETPVGITAGSYVHPSLSPDGERLAFTITTPTGSDVWVRDISRGTALRLTSDGRSLWPVWSPDGSQIAYASSREGSTNVYVKRSDGSGAEQRWTSSPYTYIPQSWSIQEFITVTHVDPVVGAKFHRLPAGGRGETRPLIGAERANNAAGVASETGVLAYTSSESGTRQVYLRVAEGGAASVQVSTHGGDEPVWARGGRELFFRQGDAFMIVAVARAGARISVGTPIQLFRGEYAAGGVRASFNVSPDGRRLLLLKNGAPRADRTRFSVVLHWTAELDSLMRRAEP